MEISRPVRALTPPAPALGLDDVGRLVDAGRHVLAHIIDRGAAGKADVLVGLEVDAEALRLDGENSTRSPVRKPTMVPSLGATSPRYMVPIGAAAARHILDDQLRLRRRYA